MSHPAMEHDRIERVTAEACRSRKESLMTPQQQTASEKEAHLYHREREHQTTLRVLRAYPPGKASFKPHETSMTAMETAWMMVGMHLGPDDIMAAEMKMTGPPPAPKTWEE